MIDDITDEISSELARSWCSDGDNCRATDKNDRCYCTEGGIIATGIILKRRRSTAVTHAQRMESIAEQRALENKMRRLNIKLIQPSNSLEGGD